MGIRASKVMFYKSCFSFEKSQSKKKLASLKAWRNMPYLKLEKTTSRMRLKNRLNLLLHTV